MRFFLIDRIRAWNVNSSAEALKNVALSEDFFDDHFPRRPIMPGVLMIEGMAQLSGLLLEASLQARYGTNAKAVLTILERTKFRDTVHPGDTLVYQTEISSLNESGGKVQVRALRDGQVVVTSAMTFAFQTVDDPELDERRKALMKVWMSEP